MKKYFVINDEQLNASTHGKFLDWYKNFGLIQKFLDWYTCNNKGTTRKYQKP